MSRSEILSHYESNIEQFLLEAFTAPWLAMDYETDGTDVRQALSGSSKTVVLGVSFAYHTPSGNIVSEYVSFNHMDYKSPQHIQDLTKKLIAEHHRLVVFSMKFERAVSQLLGIQIRGRMYCAQMIAHLIDQGHYEYSLDRISRDYGGNSKNKSPEMESIIKGLGWAFVPFLMMREYAVNDAIITLELFDKLYPKFCAMGYEGKFWDREVRRADVLTKIESVGMLADVDFINSEIEIGKARMAEIVRQLQGRNPKSPNDCHYLLIELLGLPVYERTPKGKPSFTKEVMKKYDADLSALTAEDVDEPSHLDIAKLILEYRGWQTAISLIYEGALANIQSDGRVRTELMPWGAKSSRLASRKPNNQQLPKVSDKRWNGNAKKAYRATPGYRLIEFDYHQLELRITVSISKEPSLMQVFAEDRDLFKEMSKALSLHREAVKTFVYSTSYGAGDEKVRTSLGISLARAKKIRADFKAAYPSIAKLARRAVLFYKKHGYIELWTGRKIVRSRFSADQDKEYAAFNWLIQGSGAEIVTEQMIRLSDLIDWNTCRMVLQVHDSLVFEIKEGTEDKWIPLIKSTMEDVSFTNAVVPFTVDYKDWGTKG